MNGTTRGRFLAASASLAGALAAPAAAQSAGSDRVRLALDLTDYANLAFFIALDRGYFTAAHLDVVVVPPGNDALGGLAAGADVAPLTVTPDFFNRNVAQPAVQIVASAAAVRAGWNDPAWLVVRQDVWDAKTIVAPADLRGRSIDGGPPGSTTDLIAREALRAAGLAPSDATYTQKLRTTAAARSALQARTIDVVAANEPEASDLQEQRLGRKWISARDAAPWLQSRYLCASAAFAAARHDVLVRFVASYLRGARDIDGSRGKWTPGLLTEAVKATGASKESLAAIPGPLYAGDGTPQRFSLSHQQELWLSLGLIPKPVAISDLIDFSVLDDARAAPAG